MKSLSKLNIFLIVLFTSIFLLVLAYIFYQTETKEIIKDKHEFLHAVTNLKLEQVINWKKGRTADAKFFPTISKFIKYTDYLKTNKNSAEAKEYFSKTLKQFIENGYDENIVFADTSGNILFSLDVEFKQFDSKRLAELKNCLKKDSVTFGDFYFKNNNEELRLNIISIIKDINNVPLGLYVQQIDPNKSLIPIIQKWPTSSKTAESLLFRTENDSIVYLNDLRHVKNSALKFRIPLSQNDVVAVKGVLGKRGIIEGTDYRSVEVLAELNQIPGTDWYMISKVDKNEIFEEIFFRAEVLIILVLISILLVTSIALYFYKLQQTHIYKNLFLKQKELAEAQEEFKTALYSIGDAVITTDTLGNIKQMNIIAENLTGWKETEAKGKSINTVFNIIDEDKNIKVDNPVDRVLKQGSVVGLANHTMLIRKDGKQLPIADSGSPIKNEENEIIGVVLVFRDQTEERKKEKLLTESEQLFRKAFTTSPDSININRMSDGMYVSVNNGFLDITGYSEAEVIGKTSYEIDIWAEIKDREKLVSGLKTNGSVKNLEARFRLKSGEVRDALMSASILELNGEMHILSITRDISKIKLTQEKIKESEANLNSLINNRNEAIWSIDKDYNYIVFNKYFSESYFATYNQKLENGINAIEILSPELKAFWKSKYDTALSGEKIEFEFTAELNNEIKVYQVFLNPIISDQKISGVSALSTDITDQKKSEKILFEKQLHLQSVINNTPIVLFVLDKDGRFTLSEGKGLEALGLKPGEVVGLSALEVYKEFPEVYGSIQKGLSGEIQSTIHDMGNLIFEVNYTPLINETGKINGLIGVATDITSSKKVEQALRQSEERLRLSLKAANQGLYDLNIQTGEAIVNDEYASMLGYDPKVFKETNSLWIERLHPADRVSTSKAYSDYISGKTSEYRVEFRQKTKDNKWKWILSIGKIVEEDKNKKPLRMLGTHTDINTVKLAEEKFRSIWENSVDAMRLVDSNGTIINVNNSYCNLFGLKKEELIGKSFNVSYTVNDTDISLEGFKQRFNTRTIQKKFETEIELLDNNLIWIELTNSFIEYEDKDALLLSIIRDITDRKNLINQLTDAKAKAEEMNRVKAYFFANMSHELRTPFVGIMGFSEILAGSLKEPEEKEMAEQILKSSKRLTDTLNKILNVTRLEFDRLDIKISSFDVVDLITQLAELFSKSASLQNTVLKTNFQSASLVIYSDAKLLDEIISNLLNNAIKFTHNGIVEITVADTIKNEENILTIKVSDNGVGIPKDKQKIIWEEFRQVSEGMNRSFEGTGLGLTLIRKYVNTLNGKIHLESEVGVGSTFTVEIPIKKGVDKSETANKLELEKKNKTIQIKSDKKPRVLYVEDDSIALSYVGLVLKSDYDIETAFDAKIAMEKVSNEKFDVLLLDINLGKGTDGVELMQMIRKLDNYKNTPMVAVTAYADIKDKEEFLVKGFTHYISKPFTSKDLLNLLEKVVV